MKKTILYYVKLHESIDSISIELSNYIIVIKNKKEMEVIEVTSSLVSE